MAKRKRGGFSFISPRKQIAQQEAQVRRGVTTKAPAVRFFENRIGSIDVLSFVNRTKNCLRLVFNIEEVEVSSVYKGPVGHRYFYVYFYMSEEKIKEALKVLVNEFHKSLQNKTIKATYLHNAYTENLVAPETPKLPIINVPSFNIVTKPNNPKNYRAKNNVGTNKAVEQVRKNIPDDNIHEDSYLWYNETTLDLIFSSNSYGTLFGLNSVPEKIFTELLKAMKSKSMKSQFEKVLLSSSTYTSILIDGTTYDFTKKIMMEESVQVRGCALKNKCSFKKEPACLLVDTHSQKIMLLSYNRKRSAIVFDYVRTEWQMVAYVLYCFFS